MCVCVCVRLNLFYTFTHLTANMESNLVMYTETKTEATHLQEAAIPIGNIPCVGHHTSVTISVMSHIQKILFNGVIMNGTYSQGWF